MMTREHICRNQSRETTYIWLSEYGHAYHRLSAIELVVLKLK